MNQISGAAGPQVAAWLSGAAAGFDIYNFGFAVVFLLVLGLAARAVGSRLKGKHMTASGSFGGAESAEATLMESADAEVETTTIGTLANWAFLQFETIAYIALALLLAATAVLGIASTGLAVWNAAFVQSSEFTLVLMVDRMLFVLMVVEILRTVRDSFRSGTLVAEPFLIVGLIASIRRVLVITLESSRAGRPGAFVPSTPDFFATSMVELGVLGGLILVMVVSIFLLRLSRHRAAR